jgi:hypothetical protein
LGRARLFGAGKISFYYIQHGAMMPRSASN